LTPREFDWWFGANPAGSLMSVARSDGRVIGVAAHSLARMIIGGEERLAAFSVHATTIPEARGHGVFAALERKHEAEAQARGAAVALAFASKPTAPIFLGPLEWTEIGRVRIWARPLPRLARRGAEAKRVERFEHDGDAARAWPNHVARDAAHLNWRYVAAPKGYVVFDDGDGYAVLGHKLHRGVPVAVVADLVARDPRPLLRACLTATRPRVRALFAVPSPRHRRLYASLGFTPTPLSLHLVGKRLAGRLDPDPRMWRFTLGDTDFF
jgi:GNAT superfamily N-acetyltransferase